MEFEWDGGKAADNLTKHGVSFADAARFEFEAALTVLDTRLAYPEPRWRSIGYIGTRLHVIVFTYRGNKVRVISLRKANSREVQSYELR